MKKDEYVESLENLLIFMCQTYEDMQKSLMDLYKEEQNEAAFKTPMIQGTGNIIGISKIADLKFNQPSLGFHAIFEKIKESREKENRSQSNV